MQEGEKKDWEADCENMDFDTESVWRGLVDFDERSTKSDSTVTTAI